MTGKLRDLTINRDGSQNIVITVPDDFTKVFEKLKDSPVTVEIKKLTKARSKDANSFCWALCSDIGKAMTPPLSKEDVYRRAIKAVGVYIEKDLPLWDIKTVRQRWESHGTGWVFEVVDDVRPGWQRCHLYFGSSTYSVDEMKLVLDWLLDECQQMELPIPLSEKEEKELLERWGNR